MQPEAAIDMNEALQRRLTTPPKKTHLKRVWGVQAVCSNKKSTYIAVSA
jgi:hypothetical protein